MRLNKKVFQIFGAIPKFDQSPDFYRTSGSPEPLWMDASGYPREIIEQFVKMKQWRIQGGSLGSDEPPSGRIRV